MNRCRWHFLVCMWMSSRQMYKLFRAPRPQYTHHRNRGSTEKEECIIFCHCAFSDGGLEKAQHAVKELYRLLGGWHQSSTKHMTDGGILFYQAGALYGAVAREPGHKRNEEIQMRKREFQTIHERIKRHTPPQCHLLRAIWAPLLARGNFVDYTLLWYLH